MFVVPCINYLNRSWKECVELTYRTYNGTHKGNWVSNFYFFLQLLITKPIFVHGVKSFAKLLLVIWSEELVVF